ncbi:nuclear transport factor 2 family protein [Cryptosporangium phraense]|uniref:Nuclear transport factor 2 family protein n=1 Tax=Cryptosporangium phraense TaxID=2593070 RepID=A0A545AWZ5_9ACTN|nr:nuclear transport factor 2 family protein [Cryptosporangium phraense]
MERYLAALNAGDADAVAACVTDDFVNEHTSAAGRSLRSRAAYRERLGGFLAEFENLHYDVEDLLVDDDRAAVAYRMSFRLHGKPVSVRGMFWFRVEDGLIAHRRDYWDGKTVEQQI